MVSQVLMFDDPERRRWVKLLGLLLVVEYLTSKVSVLLPLAR